LFSNINTIGTASSRETLQRVVKTYELMMGLTTDSLLNVSWHETVNKRKSVSSSILARLCINCPLKCRG